MPPGEADGALWDLIEQPVLFALVALAKHKFFPLNEWLLVDHGSPKSQFSLSVVHR